MMSAQHHHEKRKHTHTQACCHGDRLRITRQVVLGHFLVRVRSLEPHLHAAAAVSAERGELVGVGPDLLTHVLSAGEDLGPATALRVFRTAVNAWRDRQTEIFSRQLRDNVLYIQTVVISE